MLFKQVEKERNDGLVTPSNGFGKVKLDGCSFGNLGWLGIEGVIRDYSSIVLRAYSKHVEKGLLPWKYRKRGLCGCTSWF